MLLRLNSLLRGHSGCRWVLIERLHQLLVRNLIPCVPLRQSISASGDLAPLGYIAASLTETLPVKVWSGAEYVSSLLLPLYPLPTLCIAQSVGGYQPLKHSGRME